MREHNEAVNALDVMPHRTEIVVDYADGETLAIEQHDGSVLRLHKICLLYTSRCV